MSITTKQQNGKKVVGRIAPAPALFAATHGAVYLDTPYNSFLRLARGGAFPVVKIGKRLYVRKTDLDDYITQQTSHAWTTHASDKQIAAQRTRRQEEREARMATA